MHLLVVSIVLIISGTVAEVKTETVQSEPLQSEVEVQEEPPSTAKRLTWRDNPNDCDLSRQWVRKDNLECLDKATSAETPRTSPAPAVSGNKQDWLRASGIPESQWTYVDYIIQSESGWNPNAVNASSGACGLGQQLPCGKWPHQWNDPVGALIDANSYAVQRYGSWSAAYSFWLSNHWW